MFTSIYTVSRCSQSMEIDTEINRYIIDIIHRQEPRSCLRLLSIDIGKKLIAIANNSVKLDNNRL